MKHAIPVLMLFFTAASILGEDKPKQTSEEKLQGTWALKSIEILGKEEKAPEGEVAYAFSKTTVVMKEKGKPDKTGTLKIDTAKSPMALDMYEKTKADKLELQMQCIFEFQGDQLRIAYAIAGPTAERPKAFDSKVAMIMILEKEKK